MNISKFTQKSVQAVQDLEKVAYEYGKVVTDSAMQFRKEGVNMGLPTFSEYEIWRTDIENVRAAKKVLEEL